ncbi:unnamed protein product [Calypogeia fissa]
MGEVVANKLGSIDVIALAIVIMTIILIIHLTLKRKRWRKKVFEEDLIEVKIGDKIDHAFSTVDTCATSSHCTCFRSRGLLRERRLSQSDECPKTQPSVELRKISFPPPQARTTTMHVDVEVADSQPRSQLELKNEHSHAPRAPGRSGFKKQKPVWEMTEQDYSFSDLLEVSLTDISPPGSEELPLYDPPPPLLKLPGWLRDPRLPRPTMEPPKPFILGPGVRLKKVNTPSVPTNGLLLEMADSSLAKTENNILLQSLHNAMELEHISVQTELDREFLASRGGAQTSVSDTTEGGEVSMLLEFPQGSSTCTATVHPSRTDDNAWPTSSDLLSLQLPGWLRDARLRRPPMQLSLRRHKAQ